MQENPAVPFSFSSSLRAGLFSETCKYNRPYFEEHSRKWRIVVDTVQHSTLRLLIPLEFGAINNVPYVGITSLVGDLMCLLEVLSS